MAARQRDYTAFELATGHESHGQSGRYACSGNEDSVKIDNPTLRRQVLGERLRVLRRKAHLTLNEVGRVINCSESKLCRVESGQRGASIEEITILLGLYQADPAQRSDVLTLARDADELDWVQSNDSTHCQHTLRRLASYAEQIVCFDPVVIPGPLQTTQYRNAVLTASPTTPTRGIDDDREADSARRQPPELLAFVGECALHRPPGSRDVLLRQFEHLRTAASEGHCAIRVLPRDRTVASGPFTLLRLPDRSPVVVLEHLTRRLFLEHPEDINAYEHAVKHLENNALNETASLELISNAAETLDT